jgi:hypothetical protein
MVMRNMIKMPANYGSTTWVIIKNCLFSGEISVTDPDETRNKGVKILPITSITTKETTVKKISSTSNILLIKSHSEV